MRRLITSARMRDPVTTVALPKKKRSSYPRPEKRERAAQCCVTPFNIPSGSDAVMVLLGCDHQDLPSDRYILLHDSIPMLPPLVIKGAQDYYGVVHEAFTDNGCFPPLAWLRYPCFIYSP